jgi:hypothetical protein
MECAYYPPFPVAPVVLEVIEKVNECDEYNGSGAPKRLWLKKNLGEEHLDSEKKGTYPLLPYPARLAWLTRPSFQAT